MNFLVANFFFDVLVKQTGGETRVFGLLENEAGCGLDRELVELLTSIDIDLTNRFPRAMDAVRPGFDEPDVAAGQLTALDCFELRSWQREEKPEIL